jgi:hypothetical protein
VIYYLPPVSFVSFVSLSFLPMFFVMMFQKLKAATDVFDWATSKIYFGAKFLYHF